MSGVNLVLAALGVDFGVSFVRVAVLWLVLLVPVGARADGAVVVGFDGAAQVMEARVRASQYYASGRLGLAAWWLRRALQAAADPVVRAALLREIYAVRAQNPLRVDLRFSAAPSSNINNGFAGQRVRIWGLPFVLAPGAQALSGMEYSGAVAVRYPVARSADAVTEVGVLGFGRVYEMSRGAREMAPDLQGSDFSFGGVTVSLMHKRQFSGLAMPTVLRLGLGQTWYGGAGYDRSVRAAIFQDFRLDRRTIVRGFSSVERRYLLRLGGDVRGWTVGAGLKRRLGRGDLVDVVLMAQGADSDDMLKAFSALRWQILYSLANPVLGVGISFTAGGARRSYPVTPYGAHGRRDFLVNAGITAQFKQVSAYGFSPLMTLEYRQVLSDIPLYARRSLALRMGAKANF